MRKILYLKSKLQVFITCMLILSISLLTFSADLDKKIAQLKNKKENPYIRISVMKKLVKDKEKGIEAPILEILGDSDEDNKLRILCLSSLEELKYNEASSTLLEIIGTESEAKEMRLACISPYQYFDSKKDIIALGWEIEKLNAEKKEKANGYLASAYLDMLLKSKFSKDDLVLYVAGRFIGHYSPDVRKRVVTLLSATNNIRWLQYLLIAMVPRAPGFDEGSPEVRTQAIKAIEKIGGKLVVAAMIDALEDEKARDDIRELLADILNRMEIGPLKKVWIDTLTKRAEEEINPKIKIKLEKALARVKDLQPKKEVK